MAAELNARCRDVSNGHGASHAGKRKRKRCHRRRMEKQQEEEGDGIKAAIPADIVGDVLKRMNPKEAIRLSSVCRYWQAPALACDPTCRPMPWKIALTRSDYELSFRLQSVANASIIVKMRPVDEFPGAVACLGSWHGWLVLHRRMPREQLFLLNPFSRVRLSLPPRDGLFDVLCLTSDPGSPGCAVIARDYDLNLLIWRPGDRSWAAETFEGRPKFCSVIVCLKEQLFVVAQNGANMRLFNLQLNPPRCNDLRVKFCMDMLDGRRQRSFLNLVESQGDLLAFDVRVFSCDYRKECSFRAFRLDWDTMAFVPVESLGADRAIFLGGGGQSFSVSAGEAGCDAGSIYFAELWSTFSWHCCSLKDCAVTSVRNQRMPWFSEDIGQFWITPSL